MASARWSSVKIKMMFGFLFCARVTWILKKQVNKNNKNGRHFNALDFIANYFNVGYPDEVSLIGNP